MNLRKIVWMYALVSSVICAAAEEPLISIVTDRRAGAPVLHGLEKITDALEAKNIVFEKTDSPDAACGRQLIIVGSWTNGGFVARSLAENRIVLPSGPEAFVIRRDEWKSKPAMIVAGSDDRGLMYAELDVADRIGWSTNRASPLSEIRETCEKPDLRDRAVSIYTMNRAYWESRFFDERYWTRYFDLLAQNRFNSVVVIFGYENGGFLAPPYPYFFDVDGFPDVKMSDVTAAEQRRNLAALNRMVQMAHERGLDFTAGIWDHIYRGGVQNGGSGKAGESARVSGVTEKNLVAYTKVALAKFIRSVPNINAIQFRMHDESGLKNSEQAGFWHEQFSVMKENGPNIRFDARAKGLPDAVIDDGLNMGVKLRVCTKYWMEQMGLPFHPTHINRENQHDRRHGYADMLCYPQRYHIQWRLWNGGTSRVLLWGDADYARRFAASCHLYDGDGFEVNEPLCTKMEAQSQNEKPFDLLTASHRYYDYEFERYWHFFQVFGRIGYNPDTPAEVWQHDFEKRFGKDAAPFVERGLHAASRVLPRIVASCYPYGYFPMTRGWAEKQRLGDLPVYAKAEGSDIAQFENFDEEAQRLIEGGETAKIRPGENAHWFEKTAAEISAHVSAAEKNIGDRGGKEFDSTITDLKILSSLAQYHARRIPAAVSYRVFERTHDPHAFDDAIQHEREAIKSWRQLVAAAGSFYADDLKFGSRGADLCGHWRDELDALKKGLTALEEQRRQLQSSGTTKAAPRIAVSDKTSKRPVVIHQRVASAPANHPLTITAEVRSDAGVKWIRLRYRSVNQHLDYETRPMTPAAEKDHYQATVSAEQIQAKWDFMYFIEVMDNAGHGTILPDLNTETPYIVVHLQR